MNEKLFNELLQSVQEGAAILRGETAPSRSFAVEEPDVTAIRKSFNLSQPKFASFLGISTRTLQNWEQRRRKPEGPAKVLLQVAAKHPEAVLDVVSETKASRTRRPRAAASRATKRERATAGGSRRTAKRRAASKKVAGARSRKGTRPPKR
jgi:putative transcriptional regulator